MDNQMISKILKQLYHFQFNLTKDDFYTVFADAAPHLWQRYSKCSHNLLDFVHGLDMQNQAKLCSHINKMMDL